MVGLTRLRMSRETLRRVLYPMVASSKKVRFYPASALKVAVAAKPVRRRATRHPA